MLQFHNDARKQESRWSRSLAWSSCRDCRSITQATFPAPRPETAQERMLVRLMARRGSYDLANASPEMVPLKDLSIPELKIEPMEGTPSDEAPEE